LELVTNKIYVMRFLLSFLLVLMVPVFVMAQDPNIKNGWEHFAKNDFKLAEASFKKALNGSDKADACLGLAFIGSALDRDDMLSNNIQLFYKYSNNPDPYMEALWQLYDSQDTEDGMKFLEQLTTTSNGKLRAYAYQDMGAHFRNITKFKESVESYRKTAAIRQWQVLGEFENISESGFDKDFGALKHPESDYKFINKYGAEVNWFTIKDANYNNWIDLEYYFEADNSIIYAQNFCNSPKDQEVQFRVGTSGSLKVWINDQLVFTEPEERNNGLDTYIFTARLMKGFNRILIQIGASEIDESNFMLRITDKSGIPVEGLTFETSRKNYPENYSFDAKVVPWSTEKYFQKKISDNPDELVNYLLLNQMYVMNQMTYQAKKNLKAARLLFPDCSYLTMQLVIAHSQDNNETEQSKCLEEIKTKDPNFRLAMNLLFDEAIEIEDYKEAQNIIDKIEKLEPESSDLYAKKIELANEKEEYESLISLIMDAYKLFPDEYQFVSLRSVVESQVKKNVKGGIKIITKYLKSHYNENAISGLIDTYTELGQISKAVDMYQMMIDNNTIAVGSYYRLYQIYYSSSNYKKAVECINECIKIAPYIGRYHGALGEAYAEMKENLLAKENLEMAIYLNPQDYDAREKLRNIQGNPDIFDSFDKIDVYDVYKKSPDASAYPEDHSAVLVDAVQKVVYAGGGSQEKHILLAKVFNATGVDTWKEHVIPVFQNQSAVIEKMEVLKKNGSKIEAQNSGAHIAFPNLEAGDAIHITYKVRNFYSGELMQNFWDMHYFNYFVPVINSSYSLLVPKDQKFNYKTYNNSLEPVVTDKEGNKLYQWKMTDSKAIKDEPYMPVLSDVGSMLYISSFSDWTKIANWYADLAHAKAKVDFEVKEIVNELFDGKQGLSDEQKVKEIYAYIQKNIRYSSVSFIQSNLIPQKASKVLSMKQGDCKDVSTLFVAMCKSQNINASLVLVNTRNNGVNSMPLPTISFNHCIAKVNLNNKDYYVELTSDNLPFSSGLESVKKAFALDVPLDRSIKVEGQIINPPTRIHNDVIRRVKVTFTDDLMKVEKETKRVGIFAAYTRNAYKDLGEEKQFKKMQESITKSYPKLKLISLKFDSALTGNNDTLTYWHTFEVPNIFTELGKMYIFDLPWSDKFDSPSFLASEERKFPVELWEFLEGETYWEEITIDIPTGKKLSEVPKNVLLTCANATYSMDYKKVGNQLIITRKLVIIDDDIKPENYTEFKKFIGDLVKADKKQVAFTL
jgi:pentatricopeptide repeat protein